jgi:hypothetical protein
VHCRSVRLQVFAASQAPVNASVERQARVVNVSMRPPSPENVGDRYRPGLAVQINRLQYSTWFAFICELRIAS